MSSGKDLAGFLVRWAYPLAVLNLLLILALGAGVSQLQLQSGIRALFSPDDPNLQAEIHIEETYGKEDNILLVVDAGEASLFSSAHLQMLESITEQAWQVPSSRRVDSVTNFLYTAVAGDDIAINPLVEDAASLTRQDIERIRTIALAEELLLGRLISASGQVGAVNISLNLQQQSKAQDLAAAVQYAREIAARAEQENPHVRIHLAGLALTEQTLAEVTAKDGASLIPLLFVLVLLGVALLLKSWLAALCTLVTVLLSIVAGMGYAGWVGMGINSVNVSAPNIIVTLAVADCVHLLSAYLRHLGEGVGRREAVLHGLTHKVYPIALTSVTTAVGFLSLNFSESPPFRELGNISAVGVIAALWVTLTILPALLLILPFRTRPIRASRSMAGVADWVIKHQKRIVIFSSVVIVALISFVPRMELNDDPTGYFSEDIALTRALQVVEQRMSGTQNVYYSLDSGTPDGIVNPAFLADAGRFVDWLRQQPEVVNVDAFTDTLKRLNRVMHEDDPDWYRLPQERAMAAQYLLLYEISVPYGQDVTYQVSEDKSALKVAVVLKNQKSRVLEFEQRSRDWLRDNANSLVARGAGHAVSFASIGLGNIKSMLFGSALALLLVSICLIFAFRSWRYGLLSLAPNMFPALLSLGLWSALVHEVNMAASVVFAITLGIVVDDTTHFLVAYREARLQRQLPPEEALRETFSGVAWALVSTTVALAAGFALLMLSDFSVNATTGILMSGTIVIALIMDLIFLPALLLRIDPWLHRQNQTVIS